MKYFSCQRALFFAGLLLLTSCVSNRKVVLLQKNDVNVKGLPKDSIVRKHEVDPSQYRIQANDILSVRFESLTPKAYDFFSTNAVAANFAVAGANPALIGELVDENGEIPFPVVGKVKVADLTIFEIQEKLQGIATQYVESPIVKVRLLNFRVTILGEVPREGVLVFNNNRVTMLEAIGLAGGLGEFADRTKVKLIRQKGNTTEVSYIDMLDENFFKSPYYYVYQNDVLIVPPLRQRPFRRYFGQNLGLVLSAVSIILLTYNLTR
jgi:polysaccharide export outer membrane protein